MYLKEEIAAKFVRTELTFEIERSLNDGDSLRLIGMPFIGVTQIMKYIRLQANQIKEHFKDYYCIYISNRYEIDDIVDSINLQLEKSKLKKIKINNGSNNGSNKRRFSYVINQTCERVSKVLPQKKVLFLLDDFSRNFQTYNDKSVLDGPTISGIRNLAKERSELRFIVSYRQPLNAEIHEDWYLNSFRRVEVGLLSEEQSEDLIRSCYYFRTNNLPSDELIKEMIHYGGRHPYLLDFIASEFSNSSKKFLRQIDRRYTIIRNYVLKQGELLFGKEEKSRYVNMLLKVLDDPTKDPANEFVECFCYTVEENESKDEFRFFSPYFGEWLKKHPGEIEKPSQLPSTSSTNLPKNEFEPIHMSSKETPEYSRVKLFLGITVSAIIILSALVSTVVVLQKFGITEIGKISLIFVFLILIIYVILLVVIAPPIVEGFIFIEASKLLFLSIGTFIENLFSFIKEKKTPDRRVIEEESQEKQEKNIIPAIFLNTIEFKTDSAKITQNYHVVLKDIANHIEKDGSLRVKIVGHADSRGDSSYNLALSQKRAKCVYDYLVRYGVNTEQINYFGFGDESPIANNKTKSNRQKNRRVEFTLIEIL